MGKRGPLLQAGVREPNGRLSRKSEDTHFVYWQRERDALRAHSMRAEFESPIGILVRAKRITDKEFTAGLAFAEARRAADAAQSLPPRMPLAQDISRIHGYDGEDTEDVAKRKAKAVSAYYRAEDALGQGSEELRAIQWIVVYQNYPDDLPQFMALKRGLGKLVAHYGRRA